MTINTWPATIARIDAWLAEHKKILFLASLALVIGIDVYNVFAHDVTEFPFEIESYTQFLSLLLSINIIAYFIIPCFFRPLTIKNILINILAVSLFFTLYYFIEMHYFKNDAVILFLLEVLRIILYFVMCLIFLAKMFQRISAEFWVYLILLNLYFPLYILFLKIMVSTID